jgi:hypothetical protein
VRLIKALAIFNEILPIHISVADPVEPAVCSKLRLS